MDSFQSAPPPGCPDHGRDSMDEFLPTPLLLIVRDGRAATLATCIMLKTVFLGLHLLAMRLPECSGMERLALVHWSFDVWNVWCLAVFVRTGRLPWSLETCVVYHVLGYLVYSLVYLHLYSREWSKNEALSRMVVTPDSALDASASVAGEDAEGAAVPPGREMFDTHRDAESGEGEKGEDVPDEEHVKKAKADNPLTVNNNEVQPEGERLKAGKDFNKVTGRDALNDVLKASSPNECADDKELRKTNGEPVNESGVKSGAQESSGHQNGGKLGDAETVIHTDADANIAASTYKKLDAAGDAGKKDAARPDGDEQNREVIEDTSGAAIKKGQPSASSGAADDTAPSEELVPGADATGLFKKSLVKIDSKNKATSEAPALDAGLPSSAEGLAKTEHKDQIKASDMDDKKTSNQSEDQKGDQKENQKGDQKDQTVHRDEHQKGDQKEQQNDGQKGSQKEDENDDQKEQSDDQKKQQKSDRERQSSGEK